MDAQTQTTLMRLLSHLSAQPPPATPYTRAKTQRNVEYARTLLLTLEKQSATVRVQSQRQAIQADLQGKRDVIKALSERVREAEDLKEAEDSEDDEDETENGAGVGVSYAPARQDTEIGIDTGQTPAMRAEVVSQEAQAQQEQQVPSSLRPRRPPQASDNRSAASTTAREMLFSGRPTPTSTKDPTNLSQSETLLSHNRTEQENLTTSLLSLASALKTSSLNFSSSLETEKEVLRRAEGGLDQSARGMEAAERRMGALRRMSEGQGWWGRVKLYGFIAGLWVACFLVSRSALSYDGVECGAFGWGYVIMD